VIASIDARLRNGMSAFGKPSQSELTLGRALRAGDVAIVEALLDLEPALVSGINYVNWTWLMEAVGVSSLAAVRLLLDRGADVNVKANDGTSAIHLAVERNQIVAGQSPLVGKPEETEAIVRMLAAAGADLDMRGFNNWTPLHRAVAQGDLGLVKLLIALGADPTQRTNIDDYSTPLEDAEAYGRNEIAAYLRTVSGTKV
jgi:ankyrin repeat protein